MAKTRTNPGRSKPPASGSLPAHGKSILAAAYESAKKDARRRGLRGQAAKASASAQAWCAVKRHYFKRGSKWIKRAKPLGRDEQPPGCTPRRRRNPTLSPAEREILQRLADKAERTGDDWGTITAMDEYLRDPDHDLRPLEYLIAVDNGIDWNLQHVGETDEDEASAKRAHQQIADAVRELSRHPHDQTYQQALAKINRDRARRAERPLDPQAAGWTADDVFAEAARIGNPRRRNPAGWTLQKTGTDRNGNRVDTYRLGEHKAELQYLEDDLIIVKVDGYWLESDVEDAIRYKSEASGLAGATKVADLFEARRVRRFPARGEDWEPYLAWFKTQDPNQADYVILLSTNDPNGSYDNLLMAPLSEARDVFDETFSESDYESNPDPDDEDEDDRDPSAEELSRRYYMPEYETYGEPNPHGEIVLASGDHWVAQDIYGDPHIFEYRHGRPTKRQAHEELGWRQTSSPSEIRSIREAQGWLGRHRYDPGTVSEWYGPFKTEQDVIHHLASVETQRNPREIWVVVAPEKHQWPVSPLKVVTRDQAIALTHARGPGVQTYAALRTGFPTEGQARSYADRVEHTQIEVSRASDGTVVYRGSLLGFSEDPAASSLKYVDRGRVFALAESNVETKLGQGKKALIARRDRSGNPAYEDAPKVVDTSWQILGVRDRRTGWPTYPFEIMPRGEALAFTRAERGYTPRHELVAGGFDSERAARKYLEYLKGIQIEIVLPEGDIVYRGGLLDLAHDPWAQRIKYVDVRALTEMLDERKFGRKGPTVRVIARNPYLGDAVELAQKRRYEEERQRWEKDGRRGPPPAPPRSRQRNPSPRTSSMSRRITGV